MQTASIFRAGEEIQTTSAFPVDSAGLLCPHCPRTASLQGLHSTSCGHVAPQICASYTALDITNNLPVIYISECLKQHKGCVDVQQNVVLIARVCGTCSSAPWVWVKSLRWPWLPALWGLHRLINLRKTRRSNSGIVSSTWRSVHQSLH